MAVSHSFPGLSRKNTKIQNCLAKVTAARRDISPTGTRRRCRLWYVIYRIKLPGQIVAEDHDLAHDRSLLKTRSKEIQKRGQQREYIPICAKSQTF